MASDLNPIEILSGIIAKDFFKDGKVCKDNKTLKLVIEESWKNIA